MLTEFQITNFKAFAGPETFPIRPLTLIFGPNSSGKSSIFQSLLMLKQTIESVDIKTNLLIKGDLVDLGSYREFIHRHETERSFSFKAMMPSFMPQEVAWKDEELRDDPLNSDLGEDTFYALYSYKDDIEECNKKYKKIGLSISFYCDKSHNTIIVSSVELFAGDSSDYLFKYQESPEKTSLFTLTEVNEPINWEDIITLDFTNVDFDLNDLNYDSNEEGLDNSKKTKLSKSNDEQLIKNNELKKDKTVRIGLDYFLPKYFEYSELTDYPSRNYADIREVLTPCAAIGLEKALKNILYIGPMREYPERYFSFSGNQTGYVGRSGKFVPDLLFSDKTLKEKVNNWFKQLDIPYELKVPRLSDPKTNIHDVFSIRLLDKNGVHVGITDVGFGISQVLPVIIQSLISRGNTILIEQPEYHLHPRLQADLADMFIESALGGQGNTFLIETHSEHLILRILRRIRETAEGTLPKGITPIKPEDVAVLYVQPGDKGSRIINIPVNEDGDFSQPWPEGFFAERARELM